MPRSLGWPVRSGRCSKDLACRVRQGLRERTFGLTQMRLGIADIVGQELISPAPTAGHLLLIRCGATVPSAFRGCVRGVEAPPVSAGAVPYGVRARQHLAAASPAGWCPQRATNGAHADVQSHLGHAVPPYAPGTLELGGQRASSPGIWTAFLDRSDRVRLTGLQGRPGEWIDGLLRWRVLGGGAWRLRDWGPMAFRVRLRGRSARLLLVR